MTHHRGLQRTVASALAWLSHAQAAELMRYVLAGDDLRARTLLCTRIPELMDECDLEDPEWREALLDELDYRVSPGADDDPDLVPTQEVPDYARFATDVR